MRKSIDIVNNLADQAVLELVHSVMHQMRSQQFQSLRDGPLPITQMEAKVLGYFGRHAGATLSDLAEHSGRDKAQLARLIKGLRERGLLDGEVDAVDKRQLRLSLTADAQALQRALAQHERRLAAAALAGFSVEDREQLQALLRRMQGNLAAGG